MEDHSNDVRSVQGIHYIERPVESSGGRLWVAGEHPELFDYFLPEKWQTTPRQRLSRSSNTYLTTSKDEINLVVKTSRVGELPIFDPIYQEGTEVTELGYNSPFEEAAVSNALASSGLPVTKLLAIYRMSQVYSIPENLRDSSRFESHKTILDLNGEPILQRDHQYITLWQYWEGSDEELLYHSRPAYQPFNLLVGYHRGLVNKKEYEILLRFCNFKLETKGFRDLAQSSTHLLLCVNKEGELSRDTTGMPIYRFCNFALITQNLAQ